VIVELLFVLFLGMRALFLSLPCNFIEADAFVGGSIDSMVYA
jgi:hypothetical protein